MNEATTIQADAMRSHSKGGLSYFFFEPTLKHHCDDARNQNDALRVS